MIYGRRYRWTEMGLLIFPALFLVLALFELELTRNASTPLTQNTLPWLDTFTPAIGLIVASRAIMRRSATSGASSSSTT